MCASNVFEENADQLSGVEDNKRPSFTSSERYYLLTDGLPAVAKKVAPLIASKKASFGDCRRQHDEPFFIRRSII